MNGNAYMCDHCGKSTKADGLSMWLKVEQEGIKFRRPGEWGTDDIVHWFCSGYCLLDFYAKELGRLILVPDNPWLLANCKEETP